MVSLPRRRYLLQRFARQLYTAVFTAVVPLMLLRLWWRGRRQSAYRRGWRQRFGFPGCSSAQLQQGEQRRLIWIHAVSVGEAQAAEAVIRALHGLAPQCAMMVTTTTPTGAEHFRKLFQKELAGESELQLFHAFAPFDLPASVRRLLAYARPEALLVMETEVWPNWLAVCEEYDLASYLVNARLSARSLQGYQRISALSEPAFNSFDHVFAQSASDAERLFAAGVEQGNLTVSGSVKFDQDTLDIDRTLARLVKASLPADRFIWLAASTHEGEESVALAAHTRLLERYPDALLVLVPRHPDRFERVAALLDTTDFPTVRRSLLQADASQAAEQIAGTSVVLLDSMGELSAFYSGCRVAFVGGSLVDRGGHNPLEPAGIGKPVVMGSSRFNFSEICDGLAAAGGLLDIDEHTLSGVLEKLAGDAQLVNSTGAAGRAFVEANRGATDRVAKIILAGIDQRFRLESDRVTARRQSSHRSGCR